MEKLKIGHAVEVNGQLTLNYSGAEGRAQNSVRPWKACGIVIDIHLGIVAIKSHDAIPIYHYCRQDDVKIIERRKSDRRKREP